MELHHLLNLGHAGPVRPAKTSVRPRATHARERKSSIARSTNASAGRMLGGEHGDEEEEAEDGDLAAVDAIDAVDAVDAVDAIDAIDAIDTIDVIDTIDARPSTSSLAPPLPPSSSRPPPSPDASSYLLSGMAVVASVLGRLSAQELRYDSARLFRNQESSRALSLELRRKRQEYKDQEEVRLAMEQKRRVVEVTEKARQEAERQKKVQEKYAEVAREEEARRRKVRARTPIPTTQSRSWSFTRSLVRPLARPTTGARGVQEGVRGDAT